MATPVDILLRVLGTPEAQAAIRSVTGSIQAMRTAWQSAAGTLAAVGATQFLRDILTAAEQQRVASAQLRAALMAQGEVAAASAGALEAQSNALKALTLVGGETINQIQRLLISMGGTADQVAALTPLVLDVAAAMGVDALTAARQLGVVFNGQAISLGRLNIRASEFSELVTELNIRFRGQAQALAAARGPLAVLSSHWGDLRGKMGDVANWSATPVVTEINRIVSAISQVANLGLHPGIEALGKFAAGLSSISPMVLGLRGAAAAAEQVSGAATGIAGLAGAPARLGSVGPIPGRSFAGGRGGFDEEEASIEAERQRQIRYAQDLLRVESDLTNLYGFRRQVIMDDPTLGEVDRRRMLLDLAREELPALEEREALLREEYERARSVDPGATLETTAEAGYRLNEALTERLRLTNEIRAAEMDQTFSGALARRIDELRLAYGNLSVAMANVTFDTVVAGVQGLSGALTSVITGAKTAGQAFAEFGAQMLTQFISMILQAVLYAKVAIPILTALGVLSGGATAAAGAGVTVGAVTGATAAVSAAAGGGFAGGGYTGDGATFEVAGSAHRGEFVVPAWRTAEMGVPALEEMTYGGGGGKPLQVVIVDNRRTARQILKDPDFRSAVVDLSQS